MYGLYSIVDATRINIVGVFSNMQDIVAEMDVADIVVAHAFNAALQDPKDAVSN